MVCDLCTALFHEKESNVISWWSFSLQCFAIIQRTVWKVSKYGVISISIFPYSDWIRRITKWISVFSPNTGKYGTETTPYLDTFSRSDDKLWVVNIYQKFQLTLQNGGRKQHLCNQFQSFSLQSFSIFYLLDQIT